MKYVIFENKQTIYEELGIKRLKNKVTGPDKIDKGQMEAGLHTRYKCGNYNMPNTKKKLERRNNSRKRVISSQYQKWRQSKVWKLTITLLNNTSKIMLHIILNKKLV